MLLLRIAQTRSSRADSAENVSWESSSKDNFYSFLLVHNKSSSADKVSRESYHFASSFCWIKPRVALSPHRRSSTAPSSLADFPYKTISRLNNFPSLFRWITPGMAAGPHRTASKVSQPSLTDVSPARIAGSQILANKNISQLASVHSTSYGGWHFHNLQFCYGSTLFCWQEIPWTDMWIYCNIYI